MFLGGVRVRVCLYPQVGIDGLDGWRVIADALARDLTGGVTGGLEHSHS